MSSYAKKKLIYYVKHTDETESVLHSPFWYPIILCSKIDPNGTEIIACDNYAEARDGILKWLKGYK